MINNKLKIIFTILLIGLSINSSFSRPPINSVANKCVGTISMPGSCPPNRPNCDKPLVVAGFGKDGLAVCTGKPAIAQQACINRCENKRDVKIGVPPCIPKPDGELPLDCRVCDLSSANPPSEGGPYCWELTQKVCENKTDPGCQSRVYPKSFKTKAAVSEQNISATVFDGSFCILVTELNGRSYYQCF